MNAFGPSLELAAACGPVPDVARALAATLDPGDAADYVADEATRIVFPERVDDPLFRSAIHRSSLDNIDAMWRIIAGRADLHAATPLGALAFAETAAEMGVPVSQFERVYRSAWGWSGSAGIAPHSSTPSGPAPRCPIWSGRPR